MKSDVEFTHGIFGIEKQPGWILDPPKPPYKPSSSDEALWRVQDAWDILLRALAWVDMPENCSEREEELFQTILYLYDPLVMGVSALERVFFELSIQSMAKFYYYRSPEVDEGLQRIRRNESLRN